jgi:hypothetical protein
MKKSKKHLPIAPTIIRNKSNRTKVQHLEFNPIGRIHSDQKETLGTPDFQDTLWLQSVHNVVYFGEGPNSDTGSFAV